MKKAEFVELLNNSEKNFGIDTENINNGYPVLNERNTVSIKFNDEILYNKILDALLAKVDNYNDDTKTINIRQEEIDTTTNLDLSNYMKAETEKIEDITGLEYFTNLTELDLGFNKISDISKIAYLTRLEVLNLEVNNITSMDDLKGLNVLKDLRLNYNDISTVPELSCAELTYLDLRANNLTDISEISKLIKLEKLYLNNYIHNGVKKDKANEINDISVLENLSSITDISITGQKLTMIGEAGSEVSLPKIFIQAQDINSIGYTENELILKNCTLNDDGTKVILSTDSRLVATVIISGGILSNSTLTVNIDEIEKTIVGISVTKAPTKTTYIAGQNFDKTGMKVTATYSDGTTKEVTSYTITDGNSLTAGKTSVTISYTENGVTKTATQGITVIAKALTGITVTKTPNDVNYIAGQNFDKTGMKVTATYNDGTTKEVANYTVTDGNNLPAGKISVTISYTENDVTKTTTQEITVIGKTLTGISVTKAPNDVNYKTGQNFDKAGMKVTATYNDGSTKEVTNYTVTDGNNLPAGKTSVTISYIEKGVKKTTTQGITVTEKLQIEIKEYTENKEGNDSYIEDISPNTTIEDMIRRIETNGQLEMFKGTEKITDKNAKIATGMKIKITLNNEHIEYTVVVKGDLTGDGEMGDADLLRMARYKAGLDKKLTGAYLKATDINNNNEKADDIDLLKLVRILVGLDSF